MALTVTAAFKAVNAKRGDKVARILVRYKKRRWVAASLSYVYDSSWTTLYEGDFEDPGEITHQLDVDEPLVFNSSGLTLRLKNTRGQWQKSTNDPSVFAATAAAPDGYDDYGTLFQVTYGHQLPDGTWEDVPQFTGYAYDFLPMPQQGVMEVAVSSSLLAEKCLADKINVAVTNEALGTGNGVNATLTTTSTGVMVIKTVYGDGVAMVPDQDYTISGTGELGAATITLVDPSLWNGVVFTWSGTKGRTNLTVEELIELYLTTVGITSYSVQNVIFPGSLSASRTLDTQDQWAAYLSATNVTTTHTPGSILKKWHLIDDFADGDYTANPAWTVQQNTGSVSVSSGKLNLVSSGLSGRTAISTPFTKTTGTWTFKPSGGWEFYFLLSNLNFANLSPGTGYRVRYFSSSSSLLLIRDDGSGLPVTLTSTTFTISAGDTVRVTRESSGLIKVWVNGVEKLSATTTTYTTGDYVVLCGIAESGSGSYTATFDEVVWSQEVDGTGAIDYSAWVVDYQYDLGSTPASLGILQRTHVLNGGTLTYKTATAPDSGSSPPSPGAYDSFVAVDTDGQMLSTPRRWLKLRIEGSTASGGYDSPEVQRLILNFSVSTVTISLVIPQGTVWDQIRFWAKVANYETGWDANGTFFFRARAAAGASIIDLTPWTNLVGLDDAHPGYDRVRNVGHAIQPPWEFTYDKDDAGEAEPTSERRFGRQAKDYDFTGAILANDVRLGQAAAQGGYEEFYLPKFRCRCPAKLIPWLELSDVGSLTWVPDPKMVEHYAGDPLQQSGFAGPQGVALAIGKRMKIVGLTKRLRATRGDLLLEEVLS